MWETMGLADLVGPLAQTARSRSLMPDYGWIVLVAALVVVVGVFLFRNVRRLDRSTTFASAPARLKLLLALLFFGGAVLTRGSMDLLLNDDIRWSLVLLLGVTSTITWAVIWFVVGPRWIFPRQENQAKSER
jgi:hypothetical protein